MPVDAWTAIAEKIRPLQPCAVHHQTVVIPVDILLRVGNRGLSKAALWLCLRRYAPPYGLRLLIFLQPLGGALKNQNAAPTTPPCFGRRPRSSLLLFESCTVHHNPQTIWSGDFFVVDGTGLEQGGSDDASRQSKQSAQWAVA